MSQITRGQKRIYDYLVEKFSGITRGSTPELTDASTTTDGAKIVLTFNKVMSLYLFEGIASAFTASDKTIASVARGSNSATIELTLNAAYVNTDVITLSYDGSVPLESADLGIVQSFTSIGVTNTVPA